MLNCHIRWFSSRKSIKRHIFLLISSFPVIHKLAMLTCFLLLKFYNKNREIRDFNYKKHYEKCKSALKWTRLLTVLQFIPSTGRSCTKIPTLPTLCITGKTRLGPTEKEFVCRTQEICVVFYSEHSITVPGLSVRVYASSNLTILIFPKLNWLLVKFGMVQTRKAPVK